MTNPDILAIGAILARLPSARQTVLQKAYTKARMEDGKSDGEASTIVMGMLTEAERATPVIESAPAQLPKPVRRRVNA